MTADREAPYIEFIRHGCHNSDTSLCIADGLPDDVVRAFRGFMIAVGYRPSTIDEYLPDFDDEDGDYILRMDREADLGQLLIAITKQLQEFGFDVVQLNPVTRLEDSAIQGLLCDPFKDTETP